MKWLVALVVPAVLWAGWNSTTILEYMSIQSLRNQNRVEVARLQEELDGLKREREALDDDAGYPLEKAIRERMIMRRPGEEILTIREGNLVVPDSRPRHERDSDRRNRPAVWESGVESPEPVPTDGTSTDPVDEPSEPLTPFGAPVDQPFLFNPSAEPGTSAFSSDD